MKKFLLAPLIIFSFSLAAQSVLDQKLNGSEQGKKLTALMGELERQHAVKDPVAMPSAQRSEQIQQEDGYSNFAFKKKLIDKSFHYYSKSSQVKPDLTDPNAEFEDEVTGVDVTVKMSRTIFFFQP